MLIEIVAAVNIVGARGTGERLQLPRTGNACHDRQIGALAFEGWEDSSGVATVFEEIEPASEIEALLSYSLDDILNHVEASQDIALLNDSVEKVSPLVPETFDYDGYKGKATWRSVFTQLTEDNEILGK